MYVRVGVYIPMQTHSWFGWMLSCIIFVCAQACVVLHVMLRMTWSVPTAGEKARSFFVKSKLPNHELSHIW